MAITAAAASIISAIVAAGASAGAGVAQNKATQRAGEEAYGLATLQREDVLKQQGIENRMANRALENQEQQSDFNMQQTREQTAYQRQLDKANYIVGLINQDASLKSRLASTKWTRR